MTAMENLLKNLPNFTIHVQDFYVKNSKGVHFKI